MLKGIDPILNADLLWTLRAMGHGDDLVIADTNFPATTMGRRVVRMDGVPGPRLLEAVPDVCRDYAAVLARPEHGGAALGRLERFAFYERARGAFAVVTSGETRLYGCVLLKKGVIRPA